MKIFNKKGITLMALGELVAFLIVIFLSFSFVIQGMDISYGTNYTNLNPYGNGTQYIGNLNNYTINAQNQTQSTFTIYGIQLNSFGIISSFVSIVWNVISGNWINHAVTSALYKLPYANSIGILFQAIFLLALLFSIVRILMRGVQP